MSSMDDLPRVDALSTSYSNYNIMTINTGPNNVSPRGRRKLASKIIGKERRSVIFCQELPGTLIFEKEVVNKCGKGDYKSVRNEKEAAVVWRTQDFNGEALKPSDTLITKVIDRLARTRTDIDTSEVRGRTAIVKLQSLGEACNCPPFVAVSWHGPFSKMTLDARKKAFNGLICFLQELCKEKNISSFIIGGDFNLNTRKDLEDEDLKRLNVRLVNKLSSRGELTVETTERKGRGRPYIPNKDNFIFCPMSGYLQVPSARTIEVELVEPEEQNLFDHDPIIGVLRLHQKAVDEESYEDEDVGRALLRELLESQAVTSTHESDDGLEEMTKRTPRKGQNKDYSPDMWFKVNKKAFGRPSQGQKDVPCTQNPLTKYGKPDMSVSSSCSSSYEAIVKSQQSSYSTSSGPLKKDGTPDMRFAANKSPCNSLLSSGYSSYGSPCSATSLASGLGSPGPLKNDGTPDMRYASNRSCYGSSSSYGGLSSSSSSSKSGYGGASSCDPLKSDGTPDIRYTANRSSYGGSSSSGGLSSNSRSSSSGSDYGGSCGPLKSDGTPDMRYAANRSTYGSSSSSGGSSYSSRSSSSGGGYRGSCGPLKSDGTPDMRFKANRR